MVLKISLLMNERGLLVIGKTTLLQKLKNLLNPNTVNCSSPRDMNLPMTGREEALKIIITEFPKSGGSWLVTMLGAALNLPKRDIYVNDEFSGFDLTHHPWYEGASSYNLTESCIIKSHELPESPLHIVTDKIVHLARDGRDVVISKYFHDKDFCVKNGISNEFTMTFSEFLEITAAEWSEYITAWSDLKVIHCSYEDLLNNPAAVMQMLFNKFNLVVNESSIKDAVEAATKEKMHKSLDKAFKHNTFVRKGIAGDWRNHFSETDKALFKKIAGESLIVLGYEQDMDW